MAKIAITKLRVSECVTNCYICSNTETKECFIVDPGDNPFSISNKIKELELTPVAILLTHGHFDHIGAATRLKEDYNIPIVATAQEEKILSDPRANLTGYFGSPYIVKADRLINDGDIISYAGITMKVLLTPGHTCGSCCFYLEDNAVLFSGDTLFCASRGRTDFPTGSEAAIINSIRTKLLVLPEDTIVYAGHMEETTIKHERLYY